MIESIPLAAIFNSVAVNMIPEKSIGYNKRALLHFTDLNEDWTLHIRNGVVEVQPFAMENPDLTVRTNSLTWKEIVAKVRKPLVAITKGDLKIEGGLGDFNGFMGKFRE